MKDTIKSIILGFQQSELPRYKERSTSIPTHLNMVISIIGVRRSGKTCLMYDTIRRLKEEGVSMENIIFLNFEDERLSMHTNDLDLIIQAYREMYPEKNLSECYFFFDEIQNVAGWEKFIRRLFDTTSKHIYITGSNARLFSTEIATELRGRTVTYTIFPLSFSEYLKFKDVEYDIIHPAKKAKLIHYALEFVMNGGFPEVITFDKDIQIKVLQNYFNTMLFRDIVERHKIRDVRILRFFIRKLMAGIGKPLSVNKIYNELRSLGYKVSNNYLYDYEQYACDIFLGLEIARFNYSEIKQAKSDKKFYSIDTGLLSAVSFSISENKGKMLENAVVLEMIKAGKEVFYFKENYECDFVYVNNNEFVPVQVAWQLDDEKTFNRELRAIKEACRHLKVKQAQIISFDEKQQLYAEDIMIEIIPFYEWAGGV